MEDKTMLLLNTDRDRESELQQCMTRISFKMEAFSTVPFVAINEINGFLCKHSSDTNQQTL